MSWQNKTLTELEELGQALHGAHWIAPTARDLGVRRDTLVKWLGGKRALPPDALLRLRALAESHRRAIASTRRGENT